MKKTKDVYKNRIVVTSEEQLRLVPSVHVEMYRAWSNRQREAAPGLPIFDVLDLSGDVLAHLAYSDVIEDGADFRFRVVGAVLGATLQGPFVGRLCSEMPFPKELVDLVLEENRWVAQNRKPLYVMRPGAATDLWGEITRLIVPVSDGRDGVRIVMSFFIVQFTDAAVMLGVDRQQTRRGATLRKDG